MAPGRQNLVPNNSTQRPSLHEVGGTSLRIFSFSSLDPGGRTRRTALCPPPPRRDEACSAQTLALSGWRKGRETEAEAPALVRSSGGRRKSFPLCGEDLGGSEREGICPGPSKWGWVDLGGFKLWVPRPSPTSDGRLSGLRGLRPVLESLEFWKEGGQQGRG